MAEDDALDAGGGASDATHTGSFGLYGSRVDAGGDERCPTGSAVDSTMTMVVRRMFDDFAHRHGGMEQLVRILQDEMGSAAVAPVVPET